MSRTKTKKKKPTDEWHVFKGKFQGFLFIFTLFGHPSADGKQHFFAIKQMKTQDEMPQKLYFRSLQYIYYCRLGYSVRSFYPSILPFCSKKERKQSAHQQKRDKKRRARNANGGCLAAENFEKNGSFINRQKIYFLFHIREWMRNENSHNFGVVDKTAVLFWDKIKILKISEYISALILI